VNLNIMGEDSKKVIYDSDLTVVSWTSIRVLQAFLSDLIGNSPSTSSSDKSLGRISIGVDHYDVMGKRSPSTLSRLQDGNITA